MTPDFADYSERDSFTAHDIEHILQIPIVDVVELLSKVPRTGPGLYQGDGCRELVKKLARGRLFADLIARRAVNAEPEIRRGQEAKPEEDDFELVNATSGEVFRVRFSGDLRAYLERWSAAAASAEAVSEEAVSEEESTTEE